ncbi:DNA-directed DNA polymerase delta [Paecilomyces lecythidis]
MVPTKDTHSKKPTVEDEVDAEGNSAASGADRKPVAWSEIFAQHESNLTSHSHILDMVKFHVAAESDAFRTVSLMLDRTRELMEELKVMQRDFLPHSSTEKILLGAYTKDLPRRPSVHNDRAKPTNASTSSSRGASESLKSQDPSRRSTPSFFFDSKPTPVSKPEQTKKGKKRSRRDEDEIDTENMEDTSSSAQKRKRTNGLVPGHDEDIKAIIPVSMETEDISDEVARRLKIREERRKNRNNNKAEKRKRESMNSNASRGSPEAPARPKKKAKSSGEDSKEVDAEHKAEKDKRKKRRSSGPDSADNKAKKVKNGDR